MFASASFFVGRSQILSPEPVYEAGAPSGMERQRAGLDIPGGDPDAEPHVPRGTELAGNDLVHLFEIAARQEVGEFLNGRRERAGGREERKADAIHGNLDADS